MNATKLRTVKIEFRGLDNFNRPVFKSRDGSAYFGSVYTLFSHGDSAATIVSYFKENIDELEYFGNRFNCEPHGWDEPWVNLQIID